MTRDEYDGMGSDTDSDSGNDLESGTDCLPETLTSLPGQMISNSESLSDGH